MHYDVFICHASEDKDDFVRPLAERLRAEHLEVWYDEFSLRPGDSLRRSIDSGLSQSRFGIVILSKNFFSKQWPQWELDGLVQLQNKMQPNAILPIWHHITKDEVLACSPPLADKFAVMSARGMDHVVLELLKTIRPEGSTLLTARDNLVVMGYQPPVVTDDWWLDVLEYSGSNPMEGTFQEAGGWGRWGFPLPPASDNPHERGKRVAAAAMQMLWRAKAYDLRLTQISHPTQIVTFISETPGLDRVCHEYLPYLVVYAPQLTIRGYGGEFEEEFEIWFRSSMEKHRQRSAQGDQGGTGLTTDGSYPFCDSEMALRHPTFGGYSPSILTGQFVHGGGIGGPPAQAFELIDYVGWFLSAQSEWMPQPIHDFLLKGLKNWGVWPWLGPEEIERFSVQFVPNDSTGCLAKALYRTRSFRSFRLTKKCVQDVKTRFDYTTKLLGLPETADALANLFIEEDFIAAYFDSLSRKPWIRS